MYNQLKEYYFTLPVEEVRDIDKAISNMKIGGYQSDIHLLSKHSEIELIKEAIDYKQNEINNLISDNNNSNIIISFIKELNQKPIIIK